MVAKALKQQNRASAKDNTQVFLVYSFDIAHVADDLIDNIWEFLFYHGIKWWKVEVCFEKASMQFLDVMLPSQHFFGCHTLFLCLKE